MAATCTNCAGSGLIRIDGHETPCPYCRPAAARAACDELYPMTLRVVNLDDARPVEYDPAEDADSELVGNPAEEDR